MWRCEREDIPAFAIFLHGNRLDCLPDEHCNGMRPKMPCRIVSLHHANLPLAGEESPHPMGYFSTDTATPITTCHKKFSDVPNIVITRDFRFFVYQNESGKVAVHFYEKWMSIRVTPIKWKFLVAES